MRCLVTGATGYIGGRLVPRLLEAGHEVRCLTRDVRRLRDVPWRDQVEVVRGDVSDPDTLTDAFDQVEVAYYLVHSLGSAGFEKLDRQAAANVAVAPPQRLSFDGSCISADRHRPARGRPPTCDRATRWRGSCWTQACRRSCCVRP